MDKIIKRIRKLLAVGNKSKNPYEGEVNTALDLAKKLMAKNNLSLSEVEIAESSDEDVQRVYSKEEKQMRFWEKLLASKVVAPIFEVEAFLHKTGYRKNSICFVGYKKDPKIAAEIYAYLVTYIKRLGKTTEGTRKKRTSYYEGLIERLIERAKEEVYLNNLEKSQQVCSRALVVVKKERINRYTAENMNIKSGRFAYRSRKDFYGDSYQRGKQAANNIDLRNRKKVEEKS